MLPVSDINILYLLFIKALSQDLLHYLEQKNIKKFQIWRNGCDSNTRIAELQSASLNHLDTVSQREECMKNIEIYRCLILLSIWAVRIVLHITNSLSAGKTYLLTQIFIIFALTKKKSIDQTQTDTEHLVAPY